MKTPLHRYTQTRTHKGEHVEIIGEVYDEPIKRTDDVEVYSRIQFIHKKIEIAPTRYFADELSHEDLKKNVDNMANNLRDII